MQLSSAAIEGMGFRRLAVGEEISAAFYSLIVYEIQGVTIPDDFAFSASGRVGTTDYVIGIGTSVNRISRELLNDDLTDNEQGWLEERHCTPPFVIVRCGPTKLYTSQGGYVQQADNLILTYDTFAAARQDLILLEQTVMPSVDTALACVFQDERIVRFRRVDRIAVGLTEKGEAIQDLIIGGGASGYVSAPIDAADVQKKIVDVVKLSGKVNSTVAKFFQLGLHDQDILKRFLYFFLALEIQTHKTYDSSFPPVPRGILWRTARRIKAALVGFRRNPTPPSTLAERFSVCVESVWVQMGKEEIATFTKLRKIRNKITHGGLAVPPPGSVAELEGLATQVQRTALPGA